MCTHNKRDMQLIGFHPYVYTNGYGPVYTCTCGKLWISGYMDWKPYIITRLESYYRMFDDL